MSHQLFAAIDAGDLQAVRSLITAGADVNFVDSTGDYPGYCPLTLAAEAGHVEIVRELLAAGARHRSFVRDAIRQGHAAIVEERLKLDDCDLDVIDDTDGITPLIHAAGGSLEIVQMLVNAGADVNAVSSEGDTPLRRAVMGGKKDIVKFLWPLSSEATRRAAGVQQLPEN
jgi:ankyrin repeat protein